MQANYESDSLTVTIRIYTTAKMNHIIYTCLGVNMPISFTKNENIGGELIFVIFMNRSTTRLTSKQNANSVLKIHD